MHLTAHAAVLLVLLALVPSNSGVCRSGRTVYGCKISQSQCICGEGCAHEYRYPSREECRRALNKGRRYDMCQANPCENKGACTQTLTNPWYRCRCEGTGFYGSRCQHACPNIGSPSVKVYPYECIVI